MDSETSLTLTYEKLKEMCDKYLLELKERGPIYDHYVLMDDGSIVAYKKPYYEGLLMKPDFPK